MIGKLRIVAPIAAFLVGLGLALPSPAVAAPAQDGTAAIEMVDGKLVMRQGSVSAQLIPLNCQVGSAFDATYLGVRVHFANGCQWLDAGNSWYFGNARLTMQTDGNLVIYDRSNRARWSTGTYGSGATQMLFQYDANLVLYRAGWASVAWSSGTYNRCNNGAGEQEMLGLQSDSNFVIYCGRVTSTGGLVLRSVWATNVTF